MIQGRRRTLAGGLILAYNLLGRPIVNRLGYTQACFVPLTSDNEGSAALQRAASTTFMQLSSRDSLAVRLVGAFRQATASQLREVIFHEVSEERARQVLVRLVRLKYLRRLGRRVMSENGGSVPYVYQLGPAGWELCGKRGDYAPRAAQDAHALAVFSVYADVVKAVRTGDVEFIEPDGCQLEVSYGKARADMALHLGIHAANERRRFCIEVEVTRKRPSYIKEKCDNYVAEMRQQDGGILPVVLFVVPHHWMIAELRRTLRTVHADYKDMFRVCTFEEVLPLMLEP